MNPFKNSTESHVQGGIIVLTLLGVTGLSAFGRPAAPLAAAGVSILLLLRFGIISNLIVKAFGAEVAITRAEEATKEATEAAAKAEAAIEALKETTFGLSLLLMAEGLSDVHTPDTLISNLSDSLSKRDMMIEIHLMPDLGFSKEELEHRLSETLNPLILLRLYGQAANELLPGETDTNSVNEVPFPALLKQIEEMVVQAPIDTARIRELFKQHGLSRNDERVEAWLFAAEEFINSNSIDFARLKRVIDSDGDTEPA